MDATSLYREEILDHYQNPHNFGKLANADLHKRQTNPLCGDDIAMWVRFIHANSDLHITPPGCDMCKVKAIKFQGKGCAICLAGASMLTDYAKGKTKKELTKFMESDMLDLLGIEVSETRKKCALLAISVLRDCLAS